MKRRDITSAVMIAAVGGMLFFTVADAEAKVQNPQSKDYQYKFKSVRTNYKDMQVLRPFSQDREVSEADLLNGLDKDGRAMYQGLDEDSKKLARELAAQSSRKGRRMATPRELKNAVETASDHMAEKIKKLQDRRLHNGMDRLPGNKEQL